jgi:phospholipase C
MRPRFYAVAAGDRIKDAWSLADFPDGAYHLCAHGPNGFFREFRGTADDPALEISFVPGRQNGTLTGDLVLTLENRDATRTLTVHIEDMAYGTERRTVLLGPGKSKTGRVEIAVELRGSHGWHDLRIRMEEAPRFEKRYAGRIETGRESMTDPAIGKG